MNLKYIGKDKESKRVIDLGDNVKIGNENFTIIGGPCSVESKEQISKIAKFLFEKNVKILRGGAFKPRTSPYSFQGLGLKGLKYLKDSAEKYQLKIISEILDPRDVEKSIDYIDIIQIGSRNMQNYALLKEVGKFNKPIMLKRGMNATIEEWLMAAEYIALEGNENIVLCERGIRTFDNFTRNTLDMTAVPILKGLTKLPVIVDPSHGTGIRHLVSPMSKAAAAVGADGIMVEVHFNPEEALSDGHQSIDFREFQELIDETKKIYDCIY
ncbi:bifunctional 3-deoxy-7-phosphoheptulonate synthase/chorismate mutase [Clostridium sp. D2Q-14]|uniref:bifunctional 3-deoxy-7-phosphoheptulonate synthase/chorismate mutase n=1 Tax=Anaeromonas gelatinilytica TaxID=2683194 RepID=UPI00193B51C7|nr:bifunctional 3-deoxy-7-phosphoheptulonate synthase/chorismate mutase [Anaeromonas gelatinilytica]MBS4534200.1 bifunctional 3-deoxy-7-phosphoheptulonate synthase/chorismate mutase [Anaeromonas gelatinilytica]